MRILPLTLALLAIVAPPAAQTVTDVVAPGAPITLAWEGPTDTTVNYRLWCGLGTAPRTIVKNFSQAELTRSPGPAGTTNIHTIRGTLTTGLPAGAQSCHLTAFQDLAGVMLESDASNVLIIPVGTKPLPPGQLRRIIQQLQALLEELQTLERRGGGQ